MKAMKRTTFFLFALAAVALCSCRTSNTEAVQHRNKASKKLTGYFVYKNDGSTLTVTPREDGRYNVDVDLFRLTWLNDGIGDYTDGGIDFTATDAGGKPIGGVISVKGKTATLTFTRSTWYYLRNGDQLVFKRQKRKKRK